jgi:hypothetical protein
MIKRKSIGAEIKEAVGCYFAPIRAISRASFREFGQAECFISVIFVLGLVLTANLAGTPQVGIIEATILPTVGMRGSSVQTDALSQLVGDQLHVKADFRNRRLIIYLTDGSVLQGSLTSNSAPKFIEPGLQYFQVVGLGGTNKSAAITGKIELKIEPKDMGKAVARSNPSDFQFMDVELHLSSDGKNFDNEYQFIRSMR